MYILRCVSEELTAAHLVESAHHAGYAAEAGEMEMDTKYESSVAAAGGKFYPLIVESLGLWSPNSLQILKSMARRTRF